MMEKEIKLNDLYESYKDLDFERYEVKIAPAISYAEIVALARTIVKSTQFTENGELHQDICKLKYLADVFFLNTYSNIEIDENNALSEYDKMVALFDGRSIMEDISYDVSYNLFVNTVKEIMVDCRQNQLTEMHTLLTSINSSLAFVLGGISKFLGESTQAIEGMDEKKLTELMKNMSGNVKKD